MVFTAINKCTSNWPRRIQNAYRKLPKASNDQMANKLLINTHGEFLNLQQAGLFELVFFLHKKEIATKCFSFFNFNLIKCDKRQLKLQNFSTLRFLLWNSQLKEGDSNLMWTVYGFVFLLFVFFRVFATHMLPKYVGFFTSAIVESLDRRTDCVHWPYILNVAYYKILHFQLQSAFVSSSPLRMNGQQFVFELIMYFLF